MDLKHSIKAQDIGEIFPLPNGDIAASDRDGKLQILDHRENYNSKFDLTGHNLLIHSLLILPNNDLLTCSADKTVRAWDFTRGYKCIKVIDSPHHEKVNLLLIGDGCVVAAFPDFSIMVLDYTDDYICIQILDQSIVSLFPFVVQVFTDNINLTLNPLALLKDGCFAAGSDKGIIKIWDPKNKFKCVHQFKGHKNRVHSIILLKNNKIASSCFGDLIIWNI
jgi:WD40 repeat protein